MGAAGAKVSWLAADITATALPERRFDLWHDRSVFHFLTNSAERRHYVEQVARAVRPGGHVM